MNRAKRRTTDEPAVAIEYRDLERDRPAFGDGRRGAPRRLRNIVTERDAVEWGIGADYLTHGFIPLVQLDQTVFTDAGPPLLIADPETRFSASAAVLA